MKYFLPLIFAFFLDLEVRCQPFTLTSEGFVNTEEPSKNFIVISDTSKSQTELFKMALLYMNKLYRSPKDVISQVENESLTINGFSENEVRRNKMHIFDLNYTITFEFKDGRIRVNAPSFKLTTFTHKRQELHLVSANAFDGSDLGIYNSAGKLKSELAKKDLEKFFAGYITEFQTALKTKQDDW